MSRPLRGATGIHLGLGLVQHLVAGPAALLVKADLFLTLGAAPEPILFQA